MHHNEEIEYQLQPKEEYFVWKKKRVVIKNRLSVPKKKE